MPSLTQKRISEMKKMGLSHKEIAEHLGTTTHSVDVMATQLYGKYGVKTNGEFLRELRREEREGETAELIFEIELRGFIKEQDYEKWVEFKKEKRIKNALE